MNRGISSKAYGTLVALSVFSMACGGSSNNDDAQAAALLWLGATSASSGVTGSVETRQAGARTAATAQNVATSAAQGVTLAHVKQTIRDRMLARLNLQLANAGKINAPRAMATAFSCQDGQCNSGQTEILNGTSNCFASGTMTANGVSYRLTASGPITNRSMELTMSGGFTLNNCRNNVIDVSTPTQVSQRFVTADGPLNVDGRTAMVMAGQNLGSTTAGSVVTTQITFSNTVTSQNRISSTGLSVDGGAAVSFDLTDSSAWTVSGPLTIAINSSTQQWEKYEGVITISGTASITGTVNGQAFSITAPVQDTMTCRVANGLPICD